MLWNACTQCEDSPLRSDADWLILWRGTLPILGSRREISKTTFIDANDSPKHPAVRQKKLPDPLNFKETAF